MLTCFFPPLFLKLLYIFLYLPLSFLPFKMILSPSQLCTLIPVADSFSISIGQLKITIFSFIHTGFAIMQPLWAGRVEVNPLSRHCPYKLLSDSSAPNTEKKLTSLCLVHNLHTALVFPLVYFKVKISIKIQMYEEKPYFKSVIYI